MTNMSNNILFVCAGNVFRSMSAMYATRKILEQLGFDEIIVDSAGTRARPEKKPIQFVIDTLSSKGLDASLHIPQKLTQDLLDKAGLVITFDKGLLKELEDKFNFTQAVLFNDFCFSNRQIEVLDILIQDIFFDPNSESKVMKPEAKIFIEESINHIVQSIPVFLEKLERHFGIEITNRTESRKQELIRGIQV